MASKNDAIKSKYRIALFPEGAGGFSLIKANKELALRVPFFNSISDRDRDTVSFFQLYL